MAKIYPKPTTHEFKEEKFYGFKAPATKLKYQLLTNLRQFFRTEMDAVPLVPKIGIYRMGCHSHYEGIPVLQTITEVSKRQELWDFVTSMKPGSATELEIHEFETYNELEDWYYEKD